MSGRCLSVIAADRGNRVVNSAGATEPRCAVIVRYFDVIHDWYWSCRWIAWRVIHDWYWIYRSKLFLDAIIDTPHLNWKALSLRGRVRVITSRWTRPIVVRCDPILAAWMAELHRQNATVKTVAQPRT